MANPSVTRIAATGTYAVYPDFAQTPFNLSYAVEFAASTTGTYQVSYTLDDPNDANWTPIWNADPTNGTDQTTSGTGIYIAPIRGLRVIFSALGGTTLARFIVLQGNTPT